MTYPTLADYTDYLKHHTPLERLYPGSDAHLQNTHTHVHIYREKIRAISCLKTDQIAIWTYSTDRWIFHPLPHPTHLHDQDGFSPVGCLFRGLARRVHLLGAGTGGGRMGGGGEGRGRGGEGGIVPQLVEQYRLFNIPLLRLCS